MPIRFKKDEEIESMRVGGKMLATILHLLASTVAVGMTPKELSEIAAKELKALGGNPAFLGFEGYPDVICISVNEQVQHSIPSDRLLLDGDVINFDFGVKYNGMITDAGITVGLGNVSHDDQRLIAGTELALEAAIATVRDGVYVGDVSAAIQAVLESHKLGIVRELVGHGVGYELHEDPEIPNYGRPGTGTVLKAGMTIAIEPIATLGGYHIVLERDGWTLRTLDRSRSAQFEHTMLVTDEGVELLTVA